MSRTIESVVDAAFPMSGGGKTKEPPPPASAVALGESEEPDEGESEQPDLGESEEPDLGESEQPGASGPRPGVYGAKGDPYTYKLNDDGTVTILSGPTGEGHTLKSGVAFDAILGQIKSGQLTPGEKAPPKQAPNVAAKPKSFSEKLDQAVTDEIDRKPDDTKMPNVRTVR